MADMEEEIRRLDAEARVRVDKTLRSINLALKLNITKIKSKKMPKELQLLIKWKEGLEYWRDRYVYPTEDTEVMAERIGTFYELCSGMK